MKILTVNIWNGGRIWDSLIPFIQKLQPDIIFMQEVFDSPREDVEQRFRSTQGIRDTLKYPYDHFTPAFINAVEVGDVVEGLMILSKFPIVENDTFYLYGEYGRRDLQTPDGFRSTPRILQHAVVEYENKKLHLYNIHGIWDEHGDDTPLRLEMAKDILSYIDDAEYVILGGDFNVQPDTKTIRMIESTFTNVLRGETETTFNMKRKENLAFGKAIADMFFVSNNVTVTEKTVHHVDVSDHLPLSIEVEL